MQEALPHLDSLFLEQGPKPASSSAEAAVGSVPSGMANVEAFAMLAAFACASSLEERIRVTFWILDRQVL